jgi:hypothetical protein
VDRNRFVEAEVEEHDPDADPRGAKLPILACTWPLDDREDAGREQDRGVEDRDDAEAVGDLIDLEDRRAQRAGRQRAADHQDHDAEAEPDRKHAHPARLGRDLRSQNGKEDHFSLTTVEARSPSGNDLA